MTVPTPDMKRGIFGATNIYDPANVVNGARVQFANNTIPAAHIDPTGLKLAALYPDPNQPGAVNNYASNQRQTDDADQIDVRGDHSFSGSDKVFVRYSNSDRGRIRSPIFAAPGNGGAFATQPLNQMPQAWSVAGGYTRVVSANAVADLLLGQTSTANLTTRQIVNMRSKQAAAYFNDNWKVSPKLTLNLGLRYELTAIISPKRSAIRTRTMSRRVWVSRGK